MIGLKLRRLIGRRATERDMHEELEALRNMAEPGELGNLTLAAENARAEQGWPGLERLFQDLRYALRMFRKSPGFTATVVFTLALGIGANAAIFAQIDAVFWSRLPVKDPRQLRSISWTGTDPESVGAIVSGNSFSYEQFQTLRKSTAFADVSCWNVTGLLRPVVAPPIGRVEVETVSGPFFETLGIKPVLGRTLGLEDDGPDGSVAVLSYGLWQRGYARDAGVLGKTLNFNGRQFTIVGVMPRGFFGLDPSIAPQAWAPLAAERTPEALRGDASACRIVARMRPGGSNEGARAEAEALLGWPGTLNRRVSVEDAAYGVGNLRSSTSTYLGIMLAITGVVLLIACANVAGLLLVRGAARQREFATRLAIGAPRSRIVRQVVTESLLLSSAGGAAAVAIAYALNPYFSSLLPRLLQVPITVFGQARAVSVAARMDVRVLAFILAATVLAGVLFSVAPALRASRAGLFAAMKGVRGQFLSGKTLIGVQVALSITLLIGAAMLIRTVNNLRSAPLGYNPQGILMLRVEPRLSGYSRERRNAYFEQATRRLEQIPSVLSASGSTVPPIGGVYATLAAAPGEQGLAFNSVGPRFFETWHWPVIAGREIGWADRGKVALVNQAFVDQRLEGRNPVGAVYRQGKGDGWRIVGVVANTKNSPREKARPILFPPFWEVSPWMTFSIRTKGDPAAVIPDVRRAVAEIDPAVDILEFNLPAQMLGTQTNVETLLTGLLVTVGALALLLCAMGLSGTLAYIVNRRTSEIGVRMALGAGRTDVVRMVVRESVVSVLVGIVAGVSAAVPLTYFIRGQLFDVPRYDPWSIGAAIAVFLLTATGAAMLPARRAARIDPMRALRHE